MKKLIWDKDFINKVICGDCLEIMKRMPDNSVDLIFTDPPYGINRKKIVGDEDFSLFRNSLPECHRVLKNNCFYLTFIGTGQHRISDVMKMSTSSQLCNKRYHPYEKYIPFVKRLLKNTSNENDTVLDPFLGSGAIAIACKALDRRFIGIEISPEYCKMAEERLKSIKKDSKQLNL